MDVPEAPPDALPSMPHRLVLLAGNGAVSPFSTFCTRCKKWRVEIRPHLFILFFRIVSLRLLVRLLAVGDPHHVHGFLGNNDLIEDPIIAGSESEQAL